ncbi:DUF998 domain-containing protein [Streptosporangium sp. NPDC004379]|uniref:DUF998 domain-containing protein n=1 Tax=Streptosporangium sp. NPDC004379 TaxID=3366189 RepID=UPI00368A062C
MIPMKPIILGGAGTCALAFALSDVVNREMSPIGETVSRFVNTQHGWLVTVGLFGFAVTAGALAVGVPDRAGKWLLGSWAACLSVAAIFPADPPGNWDHPSISETVHGLAAWTGLAVFTVAVVILTRRWRRNAGTPLPLRPVAVAVVTGMILFVITLVDVMAFRVLPPLIGLTERFVVAADLAWMCLAAVCPHAPRRSPSR